MKKTDPGRPGPGIEISIPEFCLSVCLYLSEDESAGGDVSVAASVGAAGDSVVAGALTLVDVWPDTGPF